MIISHDTCQQHKVAGVCDQCVISVCVCVCVCVCVPPAAADESPADGDDEDHEHEAGQDDVQHPPLCREERQHYITGGKALDGLGVVLGVSEDQKVIWMICTLWTDFDYHE